MSAKRKVWTVMIALAASMWGISGLLAKYLFDQAPQVTPILLSQLRMIIGGVVLLTMSSLKKEKPFAIWKDKRSLLYSFSQGLLGFLPIQFCYFMAVKLGNASIATILQFIGPFFILAYLAVFEHQKPRRMEIFCAVVAFIGVFILTTHGKFSELSITPVVLMWGLLSAIGEVSNTLIPRSLLKVYSSTVVTGWGLIFAGIGMIAIHPTYHPVAWTTGSVWATVGVIVIGTIFPFQIFTHALKYVPSTVASMVSAFEPITATLGSIIIFGLTMESSDIVGSLLVLVAVLALSIRPHDNFEKSVRKKLDKDN